MFEIHFVSYGYVKRKHPCVNVYHLPPQVEKNINNMIIKMPHQLFINGEFVDAEGGKTYKTINPTDGTVREKRKHKECKIYILYNILLYRIMSSL